MATLGDRTRFARADTATAPVFSCATSGHPPLPQHHPEIIWRAGLDLNPLDVRNPEDTDWLETLVWPGQDARLARLRAAIAVAQNCASAQHVQAT